VKFNISVNGQYYCGESDKTIPANISGNGWNLPNHNELNELLFGKFPKIINGHRCLRSELDKIIRRAEMGIININEITIRSENE
jgi:hypothetical protein